MASIIDQTERDLERHLSIDKLKVKLSKSQNREAKSHTVQAVGNVNISIFDRASSKLSEISFQ